MAEDSQQSQDDFWETLEDAKVTVEQWPEWQRQYDADVHYEDEPSSVTSPATVAQPPV